MYTSCSERVARAIANDLLQLAAVNLDDLNPEIRPVLVEIEWHGEVVDMCSVSGIVECGFGIDYPAKYEHRDTQPFGLAWHTLGADGIQSRSASLFRTDHKGWMGDHREWGEVAIFVRNAARPPTVKSVRSDFAWA